MNIDECIATPCGTNAYCHDTLGTYICDCIPGYELDPYKECVDIDECTKDGACPHECTNKARITSLLRHYYVIYKILVLILLKPGGYDCECREGFRLHPSNFECVNIDECLVSLVGEPVCHTWADCTDTEGSFECKCKDGYEGNGFECVEIDLCSPAGRCANGECIILQDVVGFVCRCDNGYRGLGN